MNNLTFKKYFAKYKKTYEVLWMFLVSTLLLSTFIYWTILNPDQWKAQLWAYFASMFGVLSIFLCAKGKHSQAIFGVIALTLWGVYNIYYNWGQANFFMITGIYYLSFTVPINIFTYIYWGKYTNNKKEVKTRKMEPVNLIVLLSVVALFTVGMSSYNSDPSYIMVWIIISSNFIAMLLMLLRYDEQWIFWIILDIAMITLYSINLNPIYLITTIFYTINAIYGWVSWKTALN